MQSNAVYGAKDVISRTIGTLTMIRDEKCGLVGAFHAVKKHWGNIGF